MRWCLGFKEEALITDGLINNMTIDPRTIQVYPSPGEAPLHVWISDVLLRWESIAAGLSLESVPRVPRTNATLGNKMSSYLYTALPGKKTNFR